MEKRTCDNCVYRYSMGWDGVLESCIDYAKVDPGEEAERMAANCTGYLYGTPSCLEEDEYTPSSTFRDYGPSNPWDAPGMSIRDFI